MPNRHSRHKVIADECERCGGKKGDDYGKGNFYNVYKDFVSIGGKRKKSLQELQKAIRTKSKICHSNKRQKTVKNTSAFQKNTHRNQTFTRKTHSEEASARTTNERNSIAREKSLITLKRNGSGALESKPCFYCKKLPSNHHCLAEVRDSNVAVEGEESKHICGRNSCILCRSNWGKPEDFASVCIDHK